MAVSFEKHTQTENIMPFYSHSCSTPDQWCGAVWWRPASRSRLTGRSAPSRRGACHWESGDGWGGWTRAEPLSAHSIHKNMRLRIFYYCNTDKINKFCLKFHRLMWVWFIRINKISLICILTGWEHGHNHKHFWFILFDYMVILQIQEPLVLLLMINITLVTHAR